MLTSMRTFIALPLPDDLRAALAAAIKRLTPLAAEVKWCNRDQLHLTLAFLGEIAPAILPHVTETLNRVCAAHPPFTCSVYGFGFFGSKRNPVSLWAGVEPVRDLMALQEDLRQELKKFGFKNEDRDFHPHITLGRCRENVNNRALIEAINEDEDVSFGNWRVVRLSLHESRLTPRGSVYRTLTHAALAGN